MLYDEDSEKEWWCNWWRDFFLSLILWLLVLGTVIAVTAAARVRGDL